MLRAGSWRGAYFFISASAAVSTSGSAIVSIPASRIPRPLSTDAVTADLPTPGIRQPYFPKGRNPAPATRPGDENGDGGDAEGKCSRERAKTRVWVYPSSTQAMTMETGSKSRGGWEWAKTSAEGGSVSRQTHLPKPRPQGLRRRPKQWRQTDTGMDKSGAENGKTDGKDCGESQQESLRRKSAAENRQ